MNDTHHDSDSENDRLLDLLADGELGDAERRHVLTRLDGEPDGWRRCALAFLEAQALQEGLRALPRDQAPVRAALVEEERGVRKLGRSPRLRPAIALVVALLLAFTLGLGVRGVFRETSAPGPAGQIDQDSQPRELLLPVVDGLEPGGDWLRRMPLALPDHERRALERRGHRVEVRRQLLPFALEDGSLAVVPVDEIAISALSDRILQ